MSERTCSVDGCGKPHRGNGLCNGHNERRRLGLDVNVPLRPRAAAGEERLCTWPGCGLPRLPAQPSHRGYRLWCPRCRMRVVRLADAHLTVERYFEMVAAQGGRCAICLTTEPGGRDMWDVDHDHACCPGRKSCGRCVRGLLCRRCNRCIGMFRDDPAVIAAALRYITQHRLVKKGGGQRPGRIALSPASPFDAILP